MKFSYALAAALVLWTSAASAATSVQSVTLKVKNMTCPVCPITVKKALEKVPGVVAAKVDYGAKTAAVEFDPRVATTDALVKATTDAGYPSTPEPGR